MEAGIVDGVPDGVVEFPSVVKVGKGALAAANDMEVFDDVEQRPRLPS